MYHKDYSNYSNELPFEIKEVLNIGWLEKNHPFNTGEAPEFLLKKIIKIIDANQINLMRGIHYCSLCDSISDQEEYISYNNKSILLGMGEIWVPGKDNSLIFAAPTLIYHYISKHKYLPPREYIDSIKDFDILSDWNGQKEYETLIAKYFSVYNKNK